MGIFSGNEKIKTFNELKYFKNAKASTNIFDGCTSLEDVDGGNIAFGGGWSTSSFSNTYIKKVVGTLGSFAFVNCKSEQIDISECEWTERAIALFMYCNNLKSVSLPSKPMPPFLSIQYMFYNCWNLLSIDLNKLDTSNASNDSSVFNGCNKLTDLKISSSLFNCCTRTENPVTTMSYLIGLPALDDNSIINLANVIPEATEARTIQLHANVKNRLNALGLTDVILERGWTIA